MEQKDYDLSAQMVNYLMNFCRKGDPNKSSVLPTWIASGNGQNRVLMLGEKDTHMGKPSMLKMIGTMLTNKAVGE
jgi:carboxylesterase type B